MNLRVLCCNHETADLSIRERLAFSNDEQFAHGYQRFQQEFPQVESVILSTCNRIEIYAAAEEARDIPSQTELARFLSDFHSIPLDDFFDCFTSQSGREAVAHLFEVSASLDSMVLGETQISGQVKEAYERSQSLDSAGPLIHLLFQTAMKIAGRIQTETKLTEGRTSIASVAVGDFGKSIFNSFSDKNVLVIGAGEMAEETLRYMTNEGTRQLTVLNRSAERAERLADQWGGHVRPFTELESALTEADIVISATGADQPIVDQDTMKRIRKATRRRTLFILDLGSPRDFEPGIGDLDDEIFLYDIDSLEATCKKNRKARAQEIEKARVIVDSATDRFMHEVFYRTTGPVIKQLRQHWHEISRTELERLGKKLEHLDTADQREIERSIERIINKLLHPPLETLKDQAKDGTPHSLIDTVKKLFNLTD